MPFNISIHFTYTFSYLTYTPTLSFYIQRKISFCKWSGAISQSTQTQCYRLCYLERERERGERKKEMQSTAQIENELLKLNDKRWLANFKREICYLCSVALFVCSFVWCFFFCWNFFFTWNQFERYTCLFIYSILLPFRGLPFHHNYIFFCWCW